MFFFFFSSRRRHTRCSRDWSSDVCSSDLTPVADILPDRSVEEEVLLRDDAEKPAVSVLSKRSNVAAVERDPPSHRVVEPEDEVSERRLAGAAWTDERDDLTSLDLEIHAIQRRLASVIESHVAQGDAVPEGVDCLSTVLDLGFQREELRYPARGREHRLRLGVRAAEKTDLHHDGTSDVQKEIG